MHSEALQDYVKQIYLLQAGTGRATTSAVADKLGVSAASATAMFKKLADAGLVEHRPYRGALLTPAGERVAVEVVRHHRLLELYLTQALGVPWDRVHVEAERLEHVLSDELEAAMDRALDPSRLGNTGYRQPKLQRAREHRLPGFGGVSQIERSLASDH